MGLWLVIWDPPHHFFHIFPFFSFLFLAYFTFTWKKWGRSQITSQKDGSGAMPGMRNQNSRTDLRLRGGNSSSTVCNTYLTLSTLELYLWTRKWNGWGKMPWSRWGVKRWYLCSRQQFEGAKVYHPRPHQHWNVKTKERITRILLNVVNRAPEDKDQVVRLEAPASRKDVLVHVAVWVQRVGRVLVRGDRDRHLLRNRKRKKRRWRKKRNLEEVF